jgi:hypothetical protein
MSSFESEGETIAARCKVSLSALWRTDSSSRLASVLALASCTSSRSHSVKFVDHREIRMLVPRS